MQKKVNLKIIDDGTLDTVVLDSVSKNTFRYDSEFRFSFKNDDEFLKDIEGEILFKLNDPDSHPFLDI